MKKSMKSMNPRITEMIKSCDTGFYWMRLWRRGQLNSERVKATTMHLNKSIEYMFSNRNIKYVNVDQMCSSHLANDNRNRGLQLGKTVTHQRLR